MTGCFQAASRLQPLYLPLDSDVDGLDSLSLAVSPQRPVRHYRSRISLQVFVQDMAYLSFLSFFFVSCFLSKYFVVRTCFFFLLQQLDAWVHGCRSLSGASKASRILLTRQAITITSSSEGLGLLTL